MPSHRFSLLPDAYAVVRLGSSDSLPNWAVEPHEGLFSVTRTPEELSIVSPEARVPSSTQAERGWRVIKLQGPFPFEQVGVLASFASPLAEHGVSIFALSTFDTDYILIKHAQLEQGLRALQEAGHAYVA